MKNKKKIFRPWLNNTMVMVTVTLFGLLISINDFNMEAVPMIICGWLIVAELVHCVREHSATRCFELMLKKGSFFDRLFDVEG